jgi:hypothetical protein
MGLLGDIYSASDLIKRRLKGLLSDPVGYVRLLDAQARDYNRNVEPVISGGLLQERPLSEKQLQDKYTNLAMLAPFGIVRNKTLEQAAKKHFGRTSVPSETGFLLDDATRLDLSGRHYGSGYIAQGDKYVPVKGQPDYLRGSRYVDHRELGDLAPEEGWDGLARFMNETGAVRYMPNTGISVVDTNMPSVDQITKAVQDFRRSGEPLYVDVDKLNGASRVSEEFARPTVDAVMEFIRKNMKPEAFK